MRNGCCSLEKNDLVAILSNSHELIWRSHELISCGHYILSSSHDLICRGHDKTKWTEDGSVLMSFYGHSCPSIMIVFPTPPLGHGQGALCMSLFSGHPIYRWGCIFLAKDLEKFSIASLAHQWIICSEWIPSEWESKKLIKKHHNNPQVIHTTPDPQLTSCEVKIYTFVRNKSIITKVF